MFDMTLSSFMRYIVPKMALCSLTQANVGDYVIDEL